MTVASTTEHQFYSRYAWCLNPVLPLRQLIYRFNEELHAYSASGGWQREEIKVNLYLFACAIACTADDYFNLRPVDFSPLGSRLPRLRMLLTAAQWILKRVSPARKGRAVTIDGFPEINGSDDIAPALSAIAAAVA